MQICRECESPRSCNATIAALRPLETFTLPGLVDTLYAFVMEMPKLWPALMLVVAVFVVIWLS